MPRMTLDSITDNYAEHPPRIVIYGPHGIGKTTFGASAPNPIVLPTEKGLAAIRVKKFPLARSYSEVISAIDTLLTQEHPFRTFVLDSLDWLEPLVWAHTAMLGNKENVEDFGYGKGYKFADEHWRTILDGLTALQEKGMVVIAIAHAQIKRFDAPDTDPYDRYQIKLHERAAGLVNEWADVIGFAHLETITVTKEEGKKKSTRGESSGARFLAVEERPAYQAKNRYSMPAELPFPKAGAWEVFANAIAGAYAPPPEPEKPLELAPLVATEPPDDYDPPDYEEEDRGVAGAAVVGQD